MSVALGLARLIGSMVALFFAADSARPQMLDVAGVWYFGETQPPSTGLLFEAGDMQPHFLWASCNSWNVSPESILRVHIELDRQTLGRIVSDKHYLVARFETDRDTEELVAERLSLDEVGPSLWLAQFSANINFFVLLARAKSLTMHVEGREAAMRRVSEPLRSYRLPDENRAQSVEKFLQACFPGMTVR